MADPTRQTPEDTTEGTATVNTETANADAPNADAPNADAPNADAPNAETLHIPATDRVDAVAGTPGPDLAFSGYTGASGVDPAPVARRRGPDPLALLVGLATLAMAVFAFVGELPDLSGVDPRWLLAGGAAVVGLVLLVSSLRGRKG